MINCLSSLQRTHFQAQLPELSYMISLGSPQLSSRFHYDAITNTLNLFPKVQLFKCFLSILTLLFFKHYTSILTRFLSIALAALHLRSKVRGFRCAFPSAAPIGEELCQYPRARASVSCHRTILGGVSNAILAFLTRCFSSTVCSVMSGIPWWCLNK